MRSATGEKSSASSPSVPFTRFVNRKKNATSSTGFVMSVSIGIPLVVIFALFFFSDSSKSTRQPIDNASSNNKQRSEEVHTLKDKEQFKPSKEAAELLQTALKLANDEKWQDMVAFCEKAAEIEPWNPFPYALIGHAYNTLHQWKEASENWRLATELEPENYEFYYHLGFSLSQQAQDEMKKSQKHSINKEAIASYEAYLRLAENAKPPPKQVAMIYTQLATIHKGMKTQDHQTTALVNYEKALELDPANELAFFNLGLVYAEKYEKSMDERDKNTAVRNFDMAIALDPNNNNFVAVRDAMLGKISPMELMSSMKSDL